MMLDKEFMEEMDKRKQSDIIENTENDALYKHELANWSWTFFNVQSDVEDESHYSQEVQISPKIKVSIFYVKKKESIWTIDIKKYKYIWWKWEEQECLKLTADWTKTLTSILDLLNSIDYWSIWDRKISLKKTSDLDFEIDESTWDILKSIIEKKEWLELVQEIIDTQNISKWDIIWIWYKKDQLDIFKLLLDDEVFFEKYKNDNWLRWNEAVWQHFFENNKWIFWYWLNYIWIDSVNDWKLEQVIAWYNFNSAWKRIDWLLSTVSEIKKFVLVEIKTHNTKLIDKQYRSEAWTTWEDLYWWVAQIQRSVNKFKELYFNKVELKDWEWNPIEHIFNIQPKAFLIIWKLDEFKISWWINQDKYWSFELYRNNINWIEVITYDELYERARYIIENIK